MFGRILVALAAIVILASPSRAADSTVANLTAASALSGAELLYCVQGGADRKCTVTQMGTFVWSNISGDCTASAGVITCTKTNGVAFGALATVTPGTGIATALGVNVGSAGAPVINGGALGTPSSGSLLNATGLPISTGVSGLGTGVATALAVAAGTGSGFALQSERASPSNFGLASVDNSTILSTSGQLSANTGTSGATIPLLNGVNTWSGAQTFSAVPILSGLSAGTQVSCLGLDSGNHIVLNAAACGSGGGGAVSSVFGRTGAVVAATNDYSFSQISGNYTLAQGPTIGANTVLGSIAGGTPAALTQTQLTSLVIVATASLSGAVPSWPNDATKFFNGAGNYITAITQITFGSGTSGVTCNTTCSVSTATLTDAPLSGAFPYAIPAADWGKNLVIPASGGALTIVAASTTGWGSGFNACVTNEDTASHTLTPTTSTIGGKSSVPIPAGDSTCFQSDGANYHFTLPPSLAVANNLADLASASTARTNLGLGTAATQNTGTSGATIPFLNGTNTWSGVQSVNSGDLALNGSGSGSTTLNAAATASGTLTLPAATDTLMGRATTDTETNKTLTSSTNSLGGITAAFGSDAKGDIYTNGGSSNIVVRLGIGSSGNCLVVAAGLPSWGSCGGGGGGLTVGTTTIASGTNTAVEFNNAGVLGEYAITGTGNVVMSASPTLTGTINAAAAALSSTLSATVVTASATGSVSAPNFVGSAAGSTTGFYFPAVSGEMGFSAAGTNKLDYGITNANQWTFATTTIFSTGNFNITVPGNFIMSSTTAASAVTINSALASTAVNAGNVSVTGGNNSQASGTHNGASVIVTTGSATGAGSTGNAGSFTVNLGTSVGGTAGAFSVVNLPQTSAAQSGTVCFNTSGSAFTYDASLGCLTSLEEMKDIHGPIAGALAETLAFRAFWFTPINRPAGSDLAEQPGFGAHQIETVDRRLVGYDPVTGKLRGVRYMEMTAVLAAAISEDHDPAVQGSTAEKIASLQLEIEDLKRAVH